MYFFYLDESGGEIEMKDIFHRIISLSESGYAILEIKLSPPPGSPFSNIEGSMTKSFWDRHCNEQQHKG